MQKDKPKRDGTIVVGLLADPGLPAEVAGDLAEELPAALSRQVSHQVLWKVRITSEELPLNEQGDIPLIETAREKMPQERWDFIVGLTELPRHLGTQPIISDLSLAHGAALISLPAIGWVRLRPHVRDTIVHLVDEMVNGTVKTARERTPDRHLRRPTELTSPVRYVPAPDAGIDSYLTLVGARGKARLLFGMVRDNRPWRLVPSLSSAIAAAAGIAAFGIFYGTIWVIADALSARRLALISVFAVATMVIWLIVYDRLWERHSGRSAPEQTVLYNAATVFTLTLGVACMYCLLLAITLAGAATVIPPDLLQSYLGHPVSLIDYAMVAWLASSMGTVAGALGSSFESEEAVRQATYSKREQERRARRRADEKAEARSGGFSREETDTDSTG